MTLSTKEMREWCRVWKDKLGWSNATLAEKAHVPKGTVDRVVNQSKTEDGGDVRLVTIRPIICALIGCTVEELETCDETPIEKENEKLMEENAKLQADMARIHDETMQQTMFFADQIKKKDRYIKALAIACGVVVAALIVCLVVSLAAS